MKTSRRFGGRLYQSLLLIFLISRWRDQAQPIVYEATGTREQIQPVIDQFEHDIVYGPPGTVENPPSQHGSFEVATMDDLDSGSIGVDVNPISSDGLQIISGPGITEYVSASPSAFSPPNALTLRAPGFDASGFMIVAELLPAGQRLPANGFGAVFANVSYLSPAAISVSGTTYPIPMTKGSGTFSFLGVLEGGSGLFSDVLINMGGLANSFTGPPASDLAVVDDIILGHPANGIITSHPGTISEGIVTTRPGRISNVATRPGITSGIITTRPGTINGAPVPSQPPKDAGIPTVQQYSRDPRSP